MKLSRARLDSVYRKYNRRIYVHPDPVEFLFDYESLRNREITGLIASSLAYGRVTQILKSVRSVLEKMDSPSDFLAGARRETLRRKFSSFRHRFTSGEEMAAMLWGAKNIIDEYGSLGACFTESFSQQDENVLPALEHFTKALRDAAGSSIKSLVPVPSRGSACKRLNLYLRWMVRRDDVDPGGWTGIKTSHLIVPLDTHMHRIGRALGLTDRNCADMRTAIEITRGFGRYCPMDPVKYDFALTRIGILKIRKDTESVPLIRHLEKEGCIPA